MPAPKYTVRRRYFTERDPHGDPLPDERLLYLELLEIDEGAGVARFAYEIAAPDGELWLATVEGFESRSDVVAEAIDEAAGSLVQGGTLSIALSEKPQLTQIEVRSADLTRVTVYRVTTQGDDARGFRYRTELDPAAALSAGRYAVVLEGGRPIFDTDLATGDFEVTEEGGRPVLDTDAAASSLLLAYFGGPQRFAFYRTD